MEICSRYSIPQNLFSSLNWDYLNPIAKLPFGYYILPSQAPPAVEVDTLFSWQRNTVQSDLCYLQATVLHWQMTQL